MKKVVFAAAVLMGLSVMATTSFAQDGEGRGRGQGPGGQEGGGPMQRIMNLDKNGDGQLTEDELEGTRMKAIFERADKDKDGVVTKDELTAMMGQRGQRGPDAGGPGAGGQGRGPGAQGAGRGPGARGMMRPGTILPEFLQNQLNLTEEQKEELAALQKRVDAQLKKILTEEQQEQLETMAQGPRRGRGEGGPQAEGEGGRRGRGQGGPEAEGEGRRRRGGDEGDRPRRPRPDSDGN